MLGKPCWSQYEMYPISGYFSKLGAHLTMLSDGKRVEFYENSLKELIVPEESIVLDIGTGTGILAMLAAKNHAKKIYAVECGDIINVAKKIIKDNGYSDKIEFIRGLSYDIDLPEKVDIIMSETMGFIGVEEGIENIMHDAKTRFGYDNTSLIPERLEINISISSDNSVRKELIDVWKKSPYGFNYSFLEKVSTQNIFTRQKISRDGIISNIGTVYRASLGNINAEKEATILEIEDDTVAEGIVGWFNVMVADNISLHSVSYEDCGHWQQFFVPFESPIRVKKGDKFIVELNYDHFPIWNVEYLIKDGSSKKFIIDNSNILRALKGKYEN